MPNQDFYEIKKIKSDLIDKRKDLLGERRKYEKISSSGGVWDLKAIEISMERIQADINAMEKTLAGSWKGDGSESS